MPIGWRDIEMDVIASYVPGLNEKRVEQRLLAIVAKISNQIQPLFRRKVEIE